MCRKGFFFSQICLVAVLGLASSSGVEASRIRCDRDGLADFTGTSDGVKPQYLWISGILSSYMVIYDVP